MVIFLFILFSLCIPGSMLSSCSESQSFSSLEYDLSLYDGFEDGSQISTKSKLGSILSQDFSSQDFSFAPSTPPYGNDENDLQGYNSGTPAKPPVKRTPKKRDIISSITHDVIGELNQLLLAKTNGVIYVNSFFFTNLRLAETLVKIHEKSGGAIKIHVLIDGLSAYHGKAALTLLTKAGIPYYAYRCKGSLNHNKQIFWSYVDEKRKRRYSLCDGSYNFTNLASGNVEHVVISRIKPDTFKRYEKHFYHILNQSKKYGASQEATSSIPVTSENIDPNNYSSSSSSSSSSIDLSPIKPIRQFTFSKSKPMLLFSPYDCIEESMISQIENTVEGGEITILSYSFDIPSVKKALKKALKRNVHVKIIVDQYALHHKKKSLKNASLKQLESLHNAGAKVLIYADKGLLKNHTKIIAIRDSNRTVVGQGSYNLTTSSRTSYNSYTWYSHKDSKRMILDIEAIYNQMENKSQSFDLHKIQTSLTSQEIYTDFIKKNTPKNKKKYVKHS